MKYEEKDILNASTESHVSKAEDNFMSAFMKYAGEEESTLVADVGENSTETNIDNEVATTEHSQNSHEEQKGIVTPGYLWGQTLPMDPSGTTNRKDGYESMSSSAEQINLEDNQDLLASSFSNFKETQRVEKAVINELLEHGRPGTYGTKTQTLMERVRRTTGRQ